MRTCVKICIQLYGLSWSDPISFFFSSTDARVKSLQKLSTKWKVRYFREKKKLQDAEEKNKELLRTIPAQWCQVPRRQSAPPGRAPQTV